MISIRSLLFILALLLSGKLFSNNGVHQAEVIYEQKKLLDIIEAHRQALQFAGRKLPEKRHLPLIWQKTWHRV